MKNFRKVLALILVVATLFSFVAMASAKTADEYSDYADVKYVEAVDVLTAIGINEGYDGAFHPADPIDRDEVAAMIARLRNGGEIDADLYVGADNVYADVKGQWSEGYVTYCSQLGIINGRNASTFDPDAKVTGVEVLKMLLCVLGYDAAEQGYTGANWQVNVVRDATKAGLLIDGADVYAAATRDEVAQYFLNALKSEMVIGYIGEGLVKITNSIWTDFEEFDFDLGEVITPDSVNDYGYEVTYCNAVISDDFLWESIPGLSYDTKGEADCYGRPSVRWIVSGTPKNILDKVYPVAASAVITDGDWDAVEAKANALTGATEIKTAEGDTANYGWTIMMDGAPMTRSKVLNAVGNGVRVEIYAAAKTVVIINTYIAEVGTVSEKYDLFELIDVDGDQLHKFALGDYELETGDMVLYYLCNGDCAENDCTASDCGEDYLHNVTVVEPVNVDVTAGDIYADYNDSILYVDGTQYQYAFNMADEYAPTQGVMTAASVDPSANYNLYLDEYGYIKYYAHPKAADSTKYAYIVEKTALQSNPTSLVGLPTEYDYTASVVNYGEDGVKEVEKNFAINDEAYELATRRYNADTGVVTENIGLLVKYKLNATTGAFELGDNDGVCNEVGVDYAAYAPVGTVLDSETFDMGNGIHANSKTVFMVRTLGLDGKYTYEQITGYQNLDGSYIAESILGKNGAYTGKTNIQYFTDADYPAFASYVFIDAKAQYATADHFMTLGTVDYRRFETALREVYGQNYKVYDALVDGERAIVAAHSTLHLAAGRMYDTMIEFRGFAATIGGKSVPLYVYTESVMPNVKWVNYVYEVEVDETYVSYTIHTADGDEEDVKLLTKDTITYVVDGEYDAVADEWNLSAEEGIVTKDEGVFADNRVIGAWIYLDEDNDDYVAELYLVMDNFLETLPAIP